MHALLFVRPCERAVRAGGPVWVAQVPPFSQVRPHRCTSRSEVLAYLDQFIPAQHRQQVLQQQDSGAEASQVGLHLSPQAFLLAPYGSFA